MASQAARLGAFSTTFGGLVSDRIYELNGDGLLRGFDGTFTNPTDARRRLKRLNRFRQRQKGPLPRSDHSGMIEWPAGVPVYLSPQSITELCTSPNQAL